jgi:hypothetical protein
VVTADVRLARTCSKCNHLPPTQSPLSGGTSRHDTRTQASAAVYQASGAPVNRLLAAFPDPPRPLTLQAYTAPCGYCANSSTLPHSLAVRRQNPVDRRHDSHATGAPLWPPSAYGRAAGRLPRPPPAAHRSPTLVRLAHGAPRKEAIRRSTTRSEITIPIFNRKRGLCGHRVPSFSTFCTGVDIPVDTACLVPANTRSAASATPTVTRRFSPKALHFPEFRSRSPCGKTPPVWVQWPRGSDTHYLSRSARPLSTCDR